jgi:hypothetical protein
VQHLEEPCCPNTVRSPAFEVTGRSALRAPICERASAPTDVHFAWALGGVPASVLGARALSPRRITMFVQSVHSHCSCGRRPAQFAPLPQTQTLLPCIAIGLRSVEVRALARREGLAGGIPMPILLHTAGASVVSGAVKRSESCRCCE